MSARSGTGKPRTQSPGHSLAGNVVFGAGLLLLLAAIALGGCAGAALALGLADHSFLGRGERGSNGQRTALHSELPVRQKCSQEH